MTVAEAAILDGRYRLLAPIGAGGMSVIWRGSDEVLQRPVAVKVLASPQTEGAADRVRREAMAIAKINHPYIADVYDYGEAAGPNGAIMPYLVMELVDGSSLAEVLARGPLSWATVAGIGAQVAAALATAHRAGVIHRDVTPANIMLGVDGVKVIDFGISAHPGQEDGQILGTPAYLAPERLAGTPAQPATDVYGLGLVLYEALAGRMPWHATTTTQMLVAHRDIPPAPLPPIAGLPPYFAHLCRQTLAVDPAARPPSAVLSTELSAIARAGDPRARRPVSPAPAASSAPLPDDQRPPARVIPHGATSLPDPAASTVMFAVAAQAPAKSVIAAAPVARTSAAPPRSPTARIAPGSGPGSVHRGRTQRRQRGISLLPTVLLALLVGCLAWASLHPGDPGTGVAGTTPSPQVSLPNVVGNPPGTGAPVQQAPGTTPTQPGAATGAACRVEYRARAFPGVGFAAAITIVNTGTEAFKDWTLTFSLDSGQRLGAGWNATWHQRGRTVTATALADNRALAAGAVVTVGFLGMQGHGYSGVPTGFAVNGNACG